MAPATLPQELSHPQYSLEEKFQACVDIIHSMPEEGPAPTTYVARLAMYALYKQITLGPCRTSKPGFWNPEGRAKWDAYKRLGDMDREEAMEFYVAIFLEAIDVGSEMLDWDVLMSKYSDLYEEFGFLREKFRIIGRELVKEDGSKVELEENERRHLERREKNGPTEMEILCSGPYSLEEKFQACVDIVHNMPKSAYIEDIKNMIMTMGDIGKLGPMPTSFAEMFTMYALFKQATLGQCTSSKPFWNIIERYKWDAWKRLGDMERDQAMAGYVTGVMEKIDYCAEHMDWDEMLSTYADDYEKLEPLLREKFRIIGRELIKEDGSRVKPQPLNNRIVGILSFNLDRARARRKLSVEIPTEGQLTPSDPSPDADYCDVHEEHTHSRSSSSSVNDPQPSSSRLKALQSKFAMMDAELRTIKTTLDALTKTSNTRHEAIIRLIKRSSRLPWRTLFFFVIYPYVVYWAMRYFARS